MRSFSVLVLCCFSPLLFAADVPGSQDLPIVPRMADAQIVDYRPGVELERIYPLGSIRKISGQLRFDGQVSARGTATSVTYELPPEHSSTDAFTAAREALQEQGAGLLFWCQARDCGESSLWANEVFGNAKLYGADDQQAYLLLRLAAPRDNTLVALYSITRGNRKAYLHVEQFDAAAPLGDLLPTSATLLRELKSTGELDFPTLSADPDATWLRLISRGLNLDTTLRVSVSGPNAEAWRQALIGQGVRAARMEAGSAKSPGLHIELLR
ncbi:MULTISPECIES: DUF4892 domain-containing protein [Pseudomonas]|jgi:hypothetical protein|uniref:DUF4892 domain-containing protein n=3 Tax=Pseudomonas fluorescens group TaxID=136843 RepID=A0AB36CRD5_9PSED|nr:MULTISPECIES: DUF4892 domain-containing protein [Pseudomonas]MBU0525202.1 DUF4892 domain-containing protein [Gammaproteobacteria bacterium]AHZ72174.1 hypothetical protein OU5_5095 [Pseudomonas mandelii JR-1]MBU0817272.1 DUF4892 domain-containing protein [Gammaproteobacteria bacterium]MBU0843051.1 DUF4892 domain-containing protein [Gammaproteobacteria bacterium]MBU1843279.1 DUF4892 domain-containing protein [Gammaproteobacteria bacterium]